MQTSNSTRTPLAAQRRPAPAAVVAAIIALGAGAAVRHVSASPTVTVGNYVAAPGTNASISLNVIDPSATPQVVSGMDLYFQVGAGTGTSPSITSLDALTGTVWPSGSAQDTGVGINSAQFNFASITTPDNQPTINPNGKLATVVVAAGSTEGAYNLNVVSTRYAGSDSTFFDVNGVVVPATFNNGTLTVTTHTWTGAAGATWDAGGSWSAASKPGAGQNAYFPAAIPASGAAITLSSGENPGSLTFAGSYTFNGGSLALSGSNVAVHPGATATINAPITTPAGGLTVFGGGTLALNATGTFNGPVAVNQGTLALGATQRVPSVSVGTALVPATVAITPTASAGATVLVTNALNVAGKTNAWVGKVDVGNGGLIVDYPAASSSPVGTIANQVAAGYAGGAWTGNGITSATAAGQPGTGAVGYGEASTLLNISGTGTGTFLGQTVDASSVLVRYTRAGDANLDGLVNFADFVSMSNHFGTPVSAGWSLGDFNYDNKVDFADFVLLSNNFGGNVSAAQAQAVQAWAQAAAVSGVPEPTSAAIATICAMALLARRRQG